jgi:hypothetical protein
MAFKDRTIEVWEPVNWVRKYQIPMDQPVHCISWLPDRHLLAVGCDRPSVEIVDLNAPRYRGFCLPGHQHPIALTLFSRDGRFLATRSEDGKCILWDCSTWKAVASFQGSGYRRSVKGFAFHPRQPLVACLARQYKAIHVFDLSEASSDRQPSPRRCTVLFLAANPKGTEPLRLGEEFKKIKRALDGSIRQGRFNLVQVWAATAEDLQREILDHQPEIIHFSGHGVGSCEGTAARDLLLPGESEQGGLIFENELGDVQLIANEALGRLFRLCRDYVKCVVLNACYSHGQAEAISRHVDYVIGMTRSIGDPAAIRFSVGFYTALQAGLDYDKAWEHGRAAIDLVGNRDHQIPILKRKR